MRLLLLHQGWLEVGAGGSERHVVEVAEGLARRGHSVAVLAIERDPERPDGDLREDTAAAGVWLGRLNNLGRHARDLGASDPVAEAALARVVSDFAPELVHAHHVNGFGLDSVRRLRRRGVPLVITIHDHWPACLLGQLIDRELRPCPGPAPHRCAACLCGPRARPWVAGLGAAAMALGPPLRRPFDRRALAVRALLAAADALITPSEFFARRLAELGYPRPLVVQPGREPRPRPLRAARATGDRLRVGFLGSVIPSKGVHVLAAAIQALPAADFELRVHGPIPAYHGETGYEERLRQWVGPTALRGAFAADDLPAILAHLDVLVIPSLWDENAPRVLEEALLSGVVPVVTAAGALQAAVRDGIDGLHFPRGDAAALAAALRRLQAEPGFLARLAAAAPPVPDVASMLAGLEGAYAHARQRFRDHPGRVGVVVLDRDAPTHTARAVASALVPDVDAMALVVHNGPGREGPLPATVERFRLPRNVGFAAGMNAGLQALRARGCDRVLLLNNDAWLEPGALRALAEAVGPGRAAAAAPLVLRARDGRVESCGLDPGVALLRPRLRGHGRPPRAPLPTHEPEALPGVALMLHVPDIERTGGLREDYFHGFEDVDLTLRLHDAGLALVVVADARCHHQGAATLGAASPRRHFYAARNHVLAAERLRPLAAPLTSLRRGGLLALALLHAARQRETPRAAALRAVLAGARAGWRGEAGEACER